MNQSNIIDNLLLFLGISILLAILIKSARTLEKEFEHIALGFKLNPFFLGFVVLGFVTSLPEISIAIFSSNKDPSLSMSNLIGATVILLTLLIGGGLLKFGDYEFKRRFSETDVRAGLLLISFIIISLLDRRISVFEGVILIVLYIIYVLHLSHKLNRRKINLNGLAKKSFFRNFFVGLGSALILVTAAYFIVQGAIALANNLGISVSLIGIFVLAFGTNLPEITILLTSKPTLSEKSFAIGNFFGSAVINTGIVGMLAIFSGGFEITNFSAFIPGIVILLFTLVLFAYFSWTGKKLSRNEGYLLIAVYVALVISEILIQLHP